MEEGDPLAQALYDGGISEKKTPDFLRAGAAGFGVGGNQQRVDRRG